MRAALAYKRYWLPVLAGFVLTLASSLTSPVLQWLILIVAMGLFFDGLTAAWTSATGAGGLWSHRQ